MNVLIVEDENVAVQRLTEMLRELDRDIQVKCVLDSVEATVDYLEKVPELDLIFMDIELGDGQSLEVFEHVQVDTPVIFVTAYQEHALRAFKQNSIDYLLKPLHKQELATAIMKYKRLHGHGQTTWHMQKAVQDIFHSGGINPKHKGRFLVKMGTRLISVPVENIAYFYTRVQTLHSEW